MDSDVIIREGAIESYISFVLKTKNDILRYVAQLYKRLESCFVDWGDSKAKEIVDYFNDIIPQLNDCLDILEGLVASLKKCQQSIDEYKSIALDIG